MTTADQFEFTHDPRRKRSQSARNFTLPHRCRSCGETYDGGKVTVTARYADCDLWLAPCCGVQHDSRTRWGGPSWARMGYDDLNAYRREEGRGPDRYGWRA